MMALERGRFFPPGQLCIPLPFRLESLICVGPKISFRNPAPSHPVLVTGGFIHTSLTGVQDF